jgi:hypothetical protein
VARTLKLKLIEASKKWALAMLEIMKTNPQFQQELARASVEVRKLLGFE